MADPYSETDDHAPRRIRVLGVKVDPLTLDQAVALIGKWLIESGSPCRYVVTPNLDHAVLMRERADLRAAYESAALVVPDGMPMIWASYLGRHPLRERVAGSDLVPALLERGLAERPQRVFLLGAAPGVADKAAAEVAKRFPRSQVVGTYSPEVGFERNSDECASIVRRINDARPDLLVVGLGAPKQELWVHEHFPQIECAVAVCAGATIDFWPGTASGLLAGCSAPARNGCTAC